MSRRSSTSTPAVGSSRNRISGSCDSALAIITRRFMPPESVMILSWRFSHSDRSRSTCSMWAGFGGLPNRPRLNATVAQTRLEGVGGQLLGDEADLEPRLAVVAHDVVPVDAHRPRGGVHDAADDADERGLAGPVRAEEREDLALVDRRGRPP